MSDETLNSPSPPEQDVSFEAFLRKVGGEMGNLIADYDWLETSLSHISGWPQNFKTTLGVVLRSPVPMVMLWGDDGLMLYNDAYSVFAGGRHPELLGSKVCEGWPEVADFNDHVMKTCLAGGTLTYKDQQLTLYRHGFAEQVWLNLDYSPIYADDGEPVGVIAIVTETTERIIAETRASIEAQRQRDMLQKMPGFAAIMQGPDHVFTYVNDAYAAIVQRGDLLGKGVREALPSLEEQGFYKILDGVYCSGEPFIARAMKVRFDGHHEDNFLDFIYQPLRDEEGNISGVFVGGYDVTKILSGAEALVQSEEQLRLATDLAEIGLWDVDTVKGFMYWDRRCKAMFGISPNVSVSLDDFYQGLHPEDLEVTRKAYEAASDPNIRATYDVEYRTIGKEDGVLRWVAAKGKGVFNEAGTCVRVSGTTLDITVRKQADQRRDILVKLHDALRQTADIATTSYEVGRVLGMALGVSRVGYGTVDSCDDSFVVEGDWTAKGVESLAGQLNLRDFGSFVDDLKAGHFIAISDTRNDPRTAQASEALEARQARSFVNVPIVEKDKTVAVLYINHDRPRVWTEAELALINDVAARARISVERARAEQSLQILAASLEEQVQERTAERNLLATVFESTDSLIVVLDLNYRILALNKAAIEDFMSLYGVCPKIGDHILDLISDVSERANVEALWSRALAGEAFTVTHEFGLDSLVRHTYEIKFNVLFDKHGTQIGAYHIATNINERVAALARLAQTEDQLRQAQKMEAVGQLTGGIAHDFNNMLAVVLGSLDLLKRRFGSEDARSQRQIDAASDAAKRAANLTQRLLAFSRQQPLRPETIDPNRLVSSMSDLLHHSIGADIRLETVLAAGVWPICADPNQLENIILNLAVNSRDAMPGGGHITIETQNVHLDARYALKEPDVTTGQYVMLAITDTGAGMPPEVLAKAFDPFFTTKEVGKGTGLGLSQVYGFVKQSNGHVKIYSEIGKGTTVKIYLPRDMNTTLPDMSTADRFEPISGEKREVILIVDDEPAVRQFSVDAFVELGYSVIEVENAAMALQVIGSNPDIALLFTDIVMPDINGRQLVEAAHIIRPELKVLYTTGYPRNAVIHNGVLDVDVELLSKPYTIDELAVRVRDLLDR